MAISSRLTTLAYMRNGAMTSQSTSIHGTETRGPIPHREILLFTTVSGKELGSSQQTQLGAWNFSLTFN